MFRPASQRKPRWLGNLKQYQLAKFDGQIDADVNRDRAINPQTGLRSPAPPVLDRRYDRS